METYDEWRPRESQQVCSQRKNRNIVTMVKWDNFVEIICFVSRHFMMGRKLIVNDVVQSWGFFSKITHILEK